MEMLIYMARCVMMLLVTWVGIRILGKRSISQMTGYELAGLMLLSTTAAEPLVYKITSKATVGVLTLAACTAIISTLALYKKFYQFDSKPSVVIANGEIDQEELRKNKINLLFLMSLLRAKGYYKVSDIAYAIIEQDGGLSVLPKSHVRPVTPADLNIPVKPAGLALPLVIDGEIQYNNLKYAKLSMVWLNQELGKAGASADHVFLAELDSEGKLYVDVYQQSPEGPPTL